MFLRKQSWRNSFAMKLCGNCIFSITKFSEMWWKRWRFWGLWGTLEIVKKWSWNILLYEEILHYAALRSEWHGSVFYSRLGIWIIFETQRFFIIPMFLRKQSRNSLANWWSVCFKMFFPNVVICGVASNTLSHRVWKLFLCSFVLFFKRKSFILSLLF